jgi:hypothetical protein
MISLCPSLLSVYTSIFLCRIESLNCSMLYGDVAWQVFIHDRKNTVVCIMVWLCRYRRPSVDKEWFLSNLL